MENRVRSNKRDGDQDLADLAEALWYDKRDQSSEKKGLINLFTSLSHYKNGDTDMYEIGILGSIDTISYVFKNRNKVPQDDVFEIIQEHFLRDA